MKHDRGVADSARTLRGERDAVQISDILFASAARMAEGNSDPLPGSDTPFSETSAGRQIGRDNLEKAISDIARVTRRSRFDIGNELVDIPDQVGRVTRLQEMARPLGKERMQQVGKWYIYMNLLASPTSIARNLVGTSINLAEGELARPYTIAVAKLMGKHGKNLANWQELSVSGLYNQINAMRRGVAHGASMASHIFKTGMTQDQMNSMAMTPEAFKGWLPNIILRTLGATDIFLHSTKLSEALHTAAYNDAVNKGLDTNNYEAMDRHTRDFVNNATPEFMDEAFEMANRGVFRGKKGEFVDALIKLRDLSDKKSFLGGTMIMPFLPTVANVAKSVMEKTLFGFAMKDQRKVMKAIYANLMDKPFNSETPVTRQNLEAMGRTLMGVTALGALGAMYKAGVIELTGPVPRDAADRDEFYSLNKQPYSLSIPGVMDGAIEYQYLGTLGPALATVKSAMDNYNSDMDISNAVRPVMDFAAALVDSSFLAGVSGLMNALKNPSAWPTYSAQISGTVTPLSGLQRFVSKYSDPEIRNAKTFIEKYTEATPMVWPISSPHDIPPRLNVYGEPVSNQEVIDYIFFKYKPSNTDPVIKEMARLRDEGFGSPSVSAADSNMHLPDAYRDKMDLHLSKYEKYSLDRDLTKGSYDLIKKFMESDGYKTMNDERRSKTLASLKTKAANRVRNIHRYNIVNTRLKNLEAPPSFATTQ